MLLKVCWMVTMNLEKIELTIRYAMIPALFFAAFAPWVPVGLVMVWYFVIFLIEDMGQNQ